MKKVKIIEENGIACGLCEALCDKVFKVEDIATVIVDHIADDLIEDVKNAIESCPTEAIEWEKNV